MKSNARKIEIESVGRGEGDREKMNRLRVELFIREKWHGTTELRRLAMYVYEYTRRIAICVYTRDDLSVRAKLLVYT